MTDTIELTVQNVSKELAETLAKESELCLATLDETVIAVLREQLTPAAPFSNGLATTVLDCEQAPATDLAALYHDRWEIGVSRQGQIVQPVRAQQTQQQTQAS